MKFLIRFFLTGIIIGLYSFSYAQNGYTVTGKVSTVKNLSGEGATVFLLSYSDSSVVKTAICNKPGDFEFDNIKTGSYIVLISKIGFKKYYSPTIQVVNANINLNNFELIPATTDLTEVTITGKRDYIEVRPDKTVLNVDRSILATGNSVFDILNTAPGVRVIENSITLKGGQKALIAINGKPIGQLSDEQLADLLKSYQSSMISQIEIINNPPARYDAAGGGVINIILKKSKDYGFKANITESASAGQDYKLNSGINLHYRTKYFNFFGAYNFNDSKIPRTLDIDRTIYQTTFNQDYTGTTHLKNNGFTAGVDFNPTPNQAIGVLMYGYYNPIGIDKTNNTAILNNSVLDSNITSKSHIDRTVTNLNYNVNYKGSFGKAAKTTLSADVDYSTYKRFSSEVLENSFFDQNDLPYRASVFYEDNSPSDINVRSERIDFTQALSKTGTLGAGLKNNQVNSNNKIDFEQRAATDPTYSPVALLTDDFVYNERINAAYLNYDDKFNKTSVSLGLRAEQTNSSAVSVNPDKTAIRSYFDLFPNLEVTQPVNTANTLIFDYNRRITRPQYQDLNPFVAYVDEYFYSTGNTFLKPQYTTVYQITDIFKEKYKLDISIQNTKDFFVPIFKQDNTTRVITATTNNIGTRAEYSAELTLPFDLNKWWNTNIYLYGSFQQYMYYDPQPTKSTTDFEVKITQNFTITNSIRAELFTSWESPTYFGIKQYAEEWATRAGISKSILNNDGSIKLAISDIFNSQYYQYTSRYQNLNLSGMEKAGSRFLTATFTYRFGKQSVQSNRKHTSGNADEQKRLSGSSNEN